VSASEGESEAQQAFCYVKSLSLFLRVGRFVDANEEKSECKLSLSPVGECERGKSEAQQIFCNVKSSLYNLCVLFNVMNTRPLRKIADIAGCY